MTPTTDTPITPPLKLFELKHPFQIRSGETISTLNARNPRVKDLAKFLKLSNDDETKALQTVLADLCKVHSDVVGEVSIPDFFVLKSWFTSFFDTETANA